jgi:diguanylate cyclase (GGDEF)-like protein
VVEEQIAELRERPRLLRRLAWYKRRADSFEQQAVVDELTGLRNQRALWRELDRRARLCSPSHPLAVVMLDFDRFSEINSNYGREVGDAVLRRGASVLRSAAATPRAAFRYGGEEFVLLVDASEDDARALAERLRAEIARQNGSLPSVTVSCGVAELTDAFEPWVALDRADAALREAKRSGRNRVTVAGRTSPGERIMLIQELEHETARRAAMALAVATLQVRDANTADHSDDVLTLCEAIGRRLGFGKRELDHLMAGAQLHDVGKVAVPSSILNKPGPLTEDEWAVIREHTVVGERILRSVPEMTDVATIVRHSHEHWDGTGYPDGVSGEDIPRASRVILCADAFHAMRADRPYRRGRPAEEALAELRACRGTQFDPVVVDALVTVAGDTRRRRDAGVSPRHRRLVALLTAFVIGGGSAVAGIPEVREAIKSVFGATTPPSVAAPNAPAVEGFGLGPLGDALTLPPAGQHRKQGAAGPDRRGPKPATDRTQTPRRDSGTRGGDGFSGAKGGGQTSDGALRTRPPRTTQTPGSGTAPAPGTTPGSTAPEGGQAPAGPDAGASPPATGNGNGKGKAKGNGNGNALGHSLPTPRAPAQPPPQQGGRDDPPALGHTKPPKPTGNGNGNGK